MPSIIAWEDPPPPKQAPADRELVQDVWAGVAAGLRERPKQWARVRPDVGTNVNNLAQLIKTGRYKSFRPTGTYDATCRRVDNEDRIWIRYIGDE